MDSTPGTSSPSEAQPTVTPLAGHSVNVWEGKLVIVGGHVKVSCSIFSLQNGNRKSSYVSGKALLAAHVTLIWLLLLFAHLPYHCTQLFDYVPALIFAAVRAFRYSHPSGSILASCSHLIALRCFLLSN